MARVGNVERVEEGGGNSEYRIIARAGGSGDIRPGDPVVQTPLPLIGRRQIATADARGKGNGAACADEPSMAREGRSLQIHGRPCCTETDIVDGQVVACARGSQAGYALTSGRAAGRDSKIQRIRGP